MRVTLTENELDNMLVCQKDMVIHFINNEKFSEAKAQLQVLKDLWEAIGYG